MNMKLLYIVAVLTTHLLASQNTQAYEYESIQKDLSLGMLPVEAAKNAHNNSEQSQNVVQQLVDGNVDVVKAVQTVAKEWSSCDDTYASVRKGVQLSPERADEIVAAIATIRGCQCNAQSFWARSRLEQRLRPRINRALVEISSSCSCASAGIEAAMEIVPNKAEDMIDAIMVAKNRAEKTADSIGQIGVIPENKYWGYNKIKTKDTNLIRNTEVCQGDFNEQDDFFPEETWAHVDSNSSQPVFNNNKTLGVHKLICKQEGEDKKDNEEKSEKLIISQYVEGQGNNQALELYNGSNKAIDLLTDNYQIEVYFHGYDFPGEVIQLKGLVEPQSTFVVADAHAAADITSVANQKVNGLIFKGADAIVLKTGFNKNPCACSVSTVASAINGIDKDNNNHAAISETKKDFIKRIEQHYENTNVQTTIVDSLGQILVNDSDSNIQKDKPIVEDATLRRLGSICKGDRIEMDEFIIQKEWQSYAIDNFLDSGNFDKQDCLVSRKDLLLTEYIEGSNDNAMIEIFNGTDRPIDFSNERYLLEIYKDDDHDPEQVIYLNGKVDRKGVFVITSSGAEKDLKNVANQTSADLDLKNARAVVLKKVVLPAYQSCYADISTWMLNNDVADLTYILQPVRDPGSGPESGDDPRDGDEGGRLASPN